MKKNLIKISLLLAAATMLLPACKETVVLPDQDENKYDQVYMPQSVNGLVAKTLPVKTEDQFLVYGANFAGRGYPTNDINVSFVVDNALVGTYNSTNNTTYEVLPAGSYALSGTSSVIPKGSLATAPLKLSVKTSGANAIKMFRSYLLPITMGSDFKINPKLRTTYFLLSSEPNLADYPDFDRSGWTIVNFSSQEANGEGPNNGRAIFAIDNNVNTFWHSQWQGASPGPPHYITVDMGKTQTVHGVNITARQVDGSGGKPQDIRIETSIDNVNWKVSGQYTLTTARSLQKKWLPDFTEARYLKLVITSSYSSTNVHLAEFGAY